MTIVSLEIEMFHLAFFVLIFDIKMLNFWINTCALNACPNISPSFFAYISDRPVSVAYKTVALMRRESARPNSFDVNLTALHPERH